MKDSDKETMPIASAETPSDLQTLKKSQLQDTHGDFYFVFPPQEPKEIPKSAHAILRDLNKYSLMM